MLIPNALARRIFLHRHLLSGEVPRSAREIIRKLGFVQVDSITTVERAHHMILWSRWHGYRPEMLTRALARRELFEHWTHDASVIPMERLPLWRHRFAANRERLSRRYGDWHGTEFHGKTEEILAHIRAHGPAGTGDVGQDEARSKGGWWEWHPSKTALEYLWGIGELAVTRREGFAKIYDLAERVYPPGEAPPAGEVIDRLCSDALERLGFATSGEIAGFWRIVSPDEARDWCRAEERAGRLISVELESADGTRRRSYARPALSEEIPPEPPKRLRLLSPFDPMLRDRARAERLFGFFYRIEVFVPEPQRQYGYYVFPLLEGDRLVGRIDLKAQRASGTLAVRAHWPERGSPLTKGREAKLRAELARLGRFTGCETISFAPDWRRPALT